MYEKTLKDKYQFVHDALRAAFKDADILGIVEDMGHWYSVAVHVIYKNQQWRHRIICKRDRFSIKPADVPGKIEVLFSSYEGFVLGYDLGLEDKKNGSYIDPSDPAVVHFVEVDLADYEAQFEKIDRPVKPKTRVEKFINLTDPGAPSPSIHNTKC